MMSPVRDMICSTSERHSVIARPLNIKYELVFNLFRLHRVFYNLHSHGHLFCNLCCPDMKLYETDLIREVDLCW